MPKSDGSLLHVAGYRIRVLGSGNLRASLHSLEEVHSSTLPTVTMYSPSVSSANREPFTLANFIDQRVQIELGTTVISEYFTISKIILFVKPIYSGYAQ